MFPIKMLTQNPTDPLSMVEMTLSIIVVSLPGLKPLLGGSTASVNGSTGTTMNETERYTEEPKHHTTSNSLEESCRTMEQVANIPTTETRGCLESPQQNCLSNTHMNACRLIENGIFLNHSLCALLGDWCMQNLILVLVRTSYSHA
jgi:hypothetical protein